MEIDSMTQEELTDVMDFLTLRLCVSRFGADFTDRAKHFMVTKQGYTLIESTVFAGTLWKSYIERGMIETYREYAGDNSDMRQAFVYAINTDYLPE